MQNHEFSETMLVHEFVSAWRKRGATIERPDAAPDTIVIRYQGKKTVIRGHGNQARMAKAVWIHLRNLGVPVKEQD